MKKTLIIVVAIVVIVLVSGYIETNHCRSWLASGPAPVVRYPDWACRLIAYPGFVGALIIELVQ